jgi:KUP system potassium uptake protein
MDADATRAVGKTALVVGALGVVFGDVGTSPIYTIQTAFDPSDPYPVQASLQSVYGVVRLRLRAARNGERPALRSRP